MHKLLSADSHNSWGWSAGQEEGMGWGQWCLIERASKASRCWPWSWIPGLLHSAAGTFATRCFRWHLALGWCRHWPTTGLGSCLSKPLDPANSSRTSFPSPLWPGQPPGHTLHLTVPVSVTHSQSAPWPWVWMPRAQELWQRMPPCLGRSLASPYPLTPTYPVPFLCCLRPRPAACSLWLGKYVMLWVSGL